MAGAGGVFVGGGVRVVMNPPPLVYVQVFYPGSEPDRHLRKRAEAVAFTARQIAPKRSGAMAAGIHVDQNRDEKGRFAFGFKVGTPVFYATYVHEGTSPHVYFSWPGKMRFPGTNQFANQIIYTDMVSHPGNEAQPFLQQALSSLAGG